MRGPLRGPLGATVGSAGARLAAERPVWFVALGLHGVAVLLVVAAALGLVLARAVLVGRRRRALPLVGASVAAILLLRAIGVELLLLTDAGYGGGAISPPQRWWTLVVWNPWFFLGGISFPLAALAARRAASPGFAGVVGTLRGLRDRRPTKRGQRPQSGAENAEGPRRSMTWGALRG
ncbi:MAG: DUF3995 domain-containing protein [Actinomycetota bacterium]|nr:DUF3995 domain-containing protein [Actinomycetota bacterium]